MALTPFTRELGSAQGRIAPQGWAVGGFALCLGSDRSGARVRLANGDLVIVSQASDAGGAKLLRARFKTRPPSEPAAGVAWTGTFYVDGEAIAVFDLTEEREFEDVAANVSAIAGAFLVELELRVSGAGLPAEVELPAFYVDSLLLDGTSNRPILANRIPAPKALRVPQDTLIKLDVMDTTASGINAAATKVYVNGVLAFDGGVFQTGWAGIGSVTSTADGGRTQRITIDPQTDFESQASVVVRVVSATNDGATIDESYPFSIEDVTPPIVVSAKATGEQAVRVDFDEGVKQLDPAASDDALNPQNWAIGIVSGLPAVWVVVTEVATVTSSSVELRTDIPLTAGAIYRAIAMGIEDVRGNAILAPNNGATFTAIGDQAPGRDFDVSELLPAANLEEDETGDLKRFLGIIQEVTDLLLRRVDRWIEIIDIDLAPEQFVDAMLQDLGNPFSFVLTLVEKRKLGRLLVPIYRSKGLQRGIMNAIRFFLGIEVTIEYPYFTGARLGVAVLGGVGPTPGTFILAGTAYDAYSYVVVAPRSLSTTERERMRAIATYMQVAHEHLVAIREPAPPPAEPNHLVLGLSKLGLNWRLH